MALRLASECSIFFCKSFKSFQVPILMDKSCYFFHVSVQKICLVHHSHTSWSGSCFCSLSVLVATYMWSHLLRSACTPTDVNPHPSTTHIGGTNWIIEEYSRNIFKTGIKKKKKEKHIIGLKQLWIKGCFASGQEYEVHPKNLLEWFMVKVQILGLRNWTKLQK